MSRIFSFTKNIYNNFYLKRSLKELLNTQEVNLEVKSLKKSLTFLASNSTKKEDYELIWSYVSDCLKSPEQLSSTEIIKQCENALRVLIFLMKEGGDICVEEVRGKMDQWVVLGEVRAITLDLSLINTLAKSLIDLLKNDD